LEMGHLAEAPQEQENSPILIVRGALLGRIQSSSCTLMTVLSDSRIVL
jgi:hypothetical protein